MTPEELDLTQVQTQPLISEQLQQSKTQQGQSDDIIPDTKEGNKAPEGRTTTVIKQQMRKKVMKVISPLGKNLSHQKWYHGFMTREEASLLCYNEGEWLVRRAQSRYNGEIYCITVKSKGRTHHIPLVRTEHLTYFVIQDFYCTEPTTLVQYCYEFAVPLNGAGVILGNYIPRQDWSVRAEQLKLGKNLGCGAFGDVMAGELRMWDGKHKVAIKRLKEEKTMPADTKLILLREASNMRGLSHPHILKFYGVHTINEPIMIIMELADEQNLLQKLKDETSPPTSQEQERYVWEIIDGMAYLESKCIIHKDLAARNCLLSDNSIKISDFGLSVVCVDNRGQKVTNNGKVPTRWRAPETFYIPAFYSNKSDVWSFGVVVYEIYSFGRKPYNHVKTAHEIRVGVRNHTLLLTVAEGTPDYIAEMQTRCMAFVKDQRPDFADLWNEVKQKMPLSRFSIWNKLKKFLVKKNQVIQIPAPTSTISLVQNPA